MILFRCYMYGTEVINYTEDMYVLEVIAQCYRLMQYYGGSVCPVPGSEVLDLSMYKYHPVINVSTGLP
jgi:hypothetical protein